MYNIKTTVIMKSYMKFSKLAFTMLITSSLFVACSDEISMNTVDTPYTANTANIKNVGQAVDLGLPSGTKWANMNVGASSESDNGILFIWGDATGTQVMPKTATSYTDVTDVTSVSDLFKMYKDKEELIGFIYDTTNVHKEDFLLSDFPLTDLDSIREARFDSIKTAYKGSKLEMKHLVDDANYQIVANVIDSTKVKYFASTKGGFKPESGATISDAPIYSIVKNAKHDPATANWGNNWRMPTSEELQELKDKCKWEFTGTGYKVTGPNKNSIFLPAAGYRYGDKLYGAGFAGYYAAGDILGSYTFPSMIEQYKESEGIVNSNENMPGILVFQHGQFDNSINVYDNLSTSYGVSIRPVTK